MARTCFDTDWRFALANPNKLDELRAALEPSFNDSAWRKLDLPHDWSIELPRHADNPSGANGGFFIDGLGWYRKSFSAPEAWRGQRVLLEFEGAYHNAELWLNGRVLAEHRATHPAANHAAPAVVISIVIVATNLLGEAMRDAIAEREGR